MLPTISIILSVMGEGGGPVALLHTIADFGMQISCHIYMDTEYLLNFIFETGKTDL